MKKGERAIAISLGSQLFHFLNFFKPTLTRPKIHIERSMLIISIDIDVGNKKVGVLNEGNNDTNVNDYLTEYQVGAIEEKAIPLFMNLFDDFCVPTTLALRGQLFEVGESAITPVLQTSVKHDIGAHGYSHRSFQDLSRSEAENELNLLSVMMKKFSITPKSFIFPKNRVAHLNLLEKYGYKCYREFGDFIHDGMYIARRNQLYDVHPSFCIDQYTNSILLKAMLNICIQSKLPFHIWFHLWNFGSNQKSIQKGIQKVLVPFLGYAKRKANEGTLSFETMFSASKNLEYLFNY